MERRISPASTGSEAARASDTALATAALSAHAVVLDFESLHSEGNMSENYEPSLTIGGFDLVAKALLNPNSGGTVLSRAGGGAFDLRSLELTSLYLGRTFDPLVLTGLRADGTTVTRILLDADGDALRRYTLDGFTNLTSVAWAGGFGDGAVQFDNVDVQAVPKPGALAVLGLGALGLLRRLRRLAPGTAR